MVSSLVDYKLYDQTLKLVKEAKRKRSFPVQAKSKVKTAPPIAVAPSASLPELPLKYISSIA